MEKTYNGWTNYATWRVNLEIFDGMPIEEFNGINDPVEPELICLHTLAEAVKERAEYYIESTSSAGLALDYALAFLSYVNWKEIAQRLIDDYCIEDNSASALCRCGKPDSACDC